eukprot:scaffold7558_cov109-Isochrysis_galbana.AAC.10
MRNANVVVRPRRSKVVGLDVSLLEGTGDRADSSSGSPEGCRQLTRDKKQRLFPSRGPPH